MDMTFWPSAVAFSAVLGVLTEFIACHYKLWIYTSPWLAVINALLVFGLIFGTFSWLAYGLPQVAQFGTGAALGIAYEAQNFAVLKWWQFPNQRCLFLKGERALTVGVGLAWGAIPLLTNFFVNRLGLV
jgi:hypothetical protein